MHGAQRGGASCHSEPVRTLAWESVSPCLPLRGRYQREALTEGEIPHGFLSPSRLRRQPPRRGGLTARRRRADGTSGTPPPAKGLPCLLCRAGPMCPAAGCAVAPAGRCGHLPLRNRKGFVQRGTSGTPSRTGGLPHIPAWLARPIAQKRKPLRAFFFAISCSPWPFPRSCCPPARQSPPTAPSSARRPRSSPSPTAPAPSAPSWARRSTRRSAGDGR